MVASSDRTRKLGRRSDRRNAADRLTSQTSQRSLMEAGHLRKWRSGSARGTRMVTSGYAFLPSLASSFECPAHLFGLLLSENPLRFALGKDSRKLAALEGKMRKKISFEDFEKHMNEISTLGDPLEKLAATVDFERFRPTLEKAAGCPRGAKEDGPTDDTVVKFKMLMLQRLHEMSLDATSTMVSDRLTWMRFCGLGLHDPVPDANTLGEFRDTLIKAGVLDELFREFYQTARAAGYIPRPGRMVDATLIAKPR